MTTLDPAEVQTLERFAELVGLRASIEPTDHNPSMHASPLEDGHHYRVRLYASRYEDSLATVYSMGPAHGTTHPEPLEVLACVVDDARIRDECRDVLDLAAYFGEVPQDERERQQLRLTWEGLTTNTANLRRWLGADYAAVLQLEHEL